jgi:hypothetical protein
MRLDRRGFCVEGDLDLVIFFWRVDFRRGLCGVVEGDLDLVIFFWRVDLRRVF